MRSRYSTEKKTTEKVSKRVKYWPYVVSIDGTDSKITAKTLLKTIKVSNQEKNPSGFSVFVALKLQNEEKPLPKSRGGLHGGILDKKTRSAETGGSPFSFDCE
jgi:hypothetical protein